MRAVLCVALLAGLCLLEEVSAGKIWAVLVAGSHGYGNYRHQSDICHAYQILHENGIPDSQIIVMMYDDIAYNSRNPYKGNIINRIKGKNVYPGVPKDYTGSEVNANTFYAVLQGRRDEVNRLTGRYAKVVESGPNDHIFVFYADHGGPGILGMPASPYIYARTLVNTLKSMHSNRRFSKLTFYLEACHSGSMFEGLLPSNINVYATTASNPHESSYACYWDYTRSAFLGDLYSVKWMEDTEAANLNTETLETQYNTVRRLTTSSHVMRYGDLSIDNLVLAQFFGTRRESFNSTLESSKATDSVPSEAVSVLTLKRRISASPIHSEERIGLEKELKELQRTMGQTRDLFYDIARSTYSELPEKSVYDAALKRRESIQNWDCYETVLETLMAICPGLDISENEFAPRNLYVLVNLCNKKPTEKIISALGAATSINPICKI